MLLQPSEIFLPRENAGTICKGFTPHVWQKEGQMSVAITETFELTSDQLPNDEVLTYAPAIYQERVPKEFDVRMVLMGNHIYSYALKNKKQALDWRQDASLGHVTAEKIATPPDVEKGVLEFARQFGLCFGSLDFGVDAQGNGGSWKSMKRGSSCGWISSIAKPGCWKNSALS